MIRIAGAAAAVLVAAMLFTFALPVSEWIDTDAACGHSPRTDPDDCFALALLLRSPEADVVGISTVAARCSTAAARAATSRRTWCVD